MFSALTERGASATLDALSLGATGYFTKPANVGGLEASMQVLRNEMIPQIKAVCTVAQTPPPRATAASVSRAHSSRTSPIEILAIGTSTGGPNALTEVFAGLPPTLPVPILIVQHMPPMFTRLLAERLSSKYPFRVMEARAGSVPEPGQVWIAPGDFHMIVVADGQQVRLAVNQDPPENSCRPAVDVLFHSVARTYGSAALAVVLTGMGQDGLRGCEAIRAAGGQILAQDEATSVVWGMPGYVVRAGLADRVLPLSLIAGEITARVRRTKAPI
jgi:two-component system chemotaxis response regulator CheB